MLTARESPKNIGGSIVSRVYVAGSAIALAVALGLALGYAFTRCPWWDEGLFSDVAVNFRNTGHLRSAVLAPNSYVNLPGPEQHTYWQFPAYLVTLGAWLRVLPVSIYSVRLFSVACGCVYVACWFIFVRAFRTEYALSLFVAGVISLDYSVIAAASDGRMDMLCAALGLAALAAYSRWRNSRSLRTAALAGICGAGCLLSHPMGFVMNACLAALIVFDLRETNWRFYTALFAPYVIFGAACLLYISQDPQLFVAQVKAISGYRVGGVRFTLLSMARDLHDRYLHFYFAPHGGLHRLKALIPLFGLAGALALVANADSRRDPLIRRMLVMLAVAYLGVAALDDMKFPYYLVYVMPLLAACGAVWLYRSFEQHSRMRYVAAILAAGYVGANAADSLYYIHRDDFAKEYRPAVAQIRQLYKPGDIIMGPSELGYVFGFSRPLIDDCYLGYRSGIRPQIYVMYSSCNPPPADKRPWIWSRAQLAAQYEEVYRNPAYAVYTRKADQH